MYTRSYASETDEIIIPDKYGGTSFYHTQQEEPGEKHTVGTRNPWEETDIHTSENEKGEESIESSTAPTKGYLGGFLSRFFKNDNFGLQKIGTEEILIIATAAFLFFSKDGDKECAIMLLLLLFLA